MSSDVVVQVDHLHKVFQKGGLFHARKIHAVHDVSFALKRGNATAIVGESGSGKTTLLHIVAGLVKPTGGYVRIGTMTAGSGRPSMREQRRQAQLIFQDPFSALNPQYNVYQVLSRPLINYGIAKSAERDDRIRNVLADVGLTPVTEYLDKVPHELSGGQRQRVVIARAVVGDPLVVLADEPTSMLDMSIRVAILDVIQRLQQEKHLSLLLVTHDLFTARYLAEETLVMYFGRFLEGGPTTAIVEQPAHPYTQLLLAAVPDPGRTGGWDSLPDSGELSETRQWLTGCPFAPRCPHVMAECTAEFPQARWIGPNHWVACHLFKSSPVVP